MERLFALSFLVVIPALVSVLVAMATNRVLQKRSRKFVPSFGIDADTLGRALRDAEKAHAAYEAKLGHRDENWADWYAQYIVETYGDGFRV
jgi:hypothetical protein